jgi:uncharacterized protein
MERVVSPCIKKCVLVDKVCTGCQRSLEQIAKWSTMTNEERQAVVKQLKPTGSE